MSRSPTWALIGAVIVVTCFLSAESRAENAQSVVRHAISVAFTSFLTFAGCLWRAPIKSCPRSGRQKEEYNQWHREHCVLPLAVRRQFHRLLHSSLPPLVRSRLLLYQRIASHMAEKPRTRTTHSLLLNNSGRTNTARSLTFRVQAQLRQRLTKMLVRLPVLRNQLDLSRAPEVNLRQILPQELLVAPSVEGRLKILASIAHLQTIRVTVVIERPVDIGKTTGRILHLECRNKVWGTIPVHMLRFLVTQLNRLVTVNMLVNNHMGSRMKISGGRMHQSLSLKCLLHNSSHLHSSNHNRRRLRKPHKQISKPPSCHANNQARLAARHVLVSATLSFWRSWVKVTSEKSCWPRPRPVANFMP